MKNYSKLIGYIDETFVDANGSPVNINKIAKWMKNSFKNATGFMTSTSVAEEAAEEFNLYVDDTDEIPEWTFQLSSLIDDEVIEELNIQEETRKKVKEYRVNYVDEGYDQNDRW